MRQVTRKGLMTVAAATGVLAATGGYAHADSGAHGTASGSPGVLSGNSVQAPVHAPVNVCGNTVNVVGVLNPAVGNKCANKGAGKGTGSGHHGNGGSGGGAGSHAGGHTSDSPGVGSGNQVRIPVHAPVNVCGNNVSVAGVGNTTTGNACGNTGGGGHGTTSPGHGGPHSPGKPGQPGDSEHPGTPGGPGEADGSDGSEGSGRPGSAGHGNQGGSNAHASDANGPGALAAGRTDGSDVSAHLAETGAGVPLGLALPVGAGALLAGAVLYRKARASA
ncbi:hypothetical protein GCM10010372_72550 [Streptomyces tauricus]|uniref:chaplin n=1 Tax=Streptomyces tauricus TaxID=68274 RepID=UPI00167479CB|nr:chaplin [Streptomyces tauricus]GHA62264.1 hypothetical protein GCM10010372_72550 [Streptomyces tauricus]